MAHAIIGMFDNPDAAALAREELRGIGVPDSGIKTAPELTSSPKAGDASDPADSGFWASLKQMFSSDEVGTDRKYSFYAEGARRGSVIVAVDAEETQADGIVKVLKSAGAVSIDANSSTARTTYDGRAV